jgi:hypothetical protein
MANAGIIIEFAGSACSEVLNQTAAPGRFESFAALKITLFE